MKKHKNNKDKKVFYFLAILFAFFILLIIINFPFVSKSNEITLNKTYISFTFDDAYQNQFNLAYPLFKKYNITATDYVVVNKVGGSFEGTKVMNWNEIKELYGAGWEIGSHTMNHPFLTRLNGDKVRYELSESKKILNERGFDVYSLAIPYGKYNREIEDIAKKYYKGVRTSSFGCNKKINFYELKSKWVKNDTSVEEIKKWIDDAEKDKCWLIIMLHHVEEKKSKEYSISVNELEEVVRYVKDKDLDVKTVKEMLEMFGR